MDPTLNQTSIVNVPPGEVKANNKGLVIGIAVCLVLAICGVGFGVYGMFFKNSNDSIPANEANKESAQSDVQTDQSLDTYSTRDLKNKVFRLLGFRNGLSTGDYYDDSGHFIVYSSYMPIEKLLSNELDDSLKTYITLETTILDKEKFCSYKWDDEVKTDVNSALGEISNQYEFGDASIDCIAYNVANTDYHDLWGSELPKLNSFSTESSIYGDFAYGSNLDAYYYHILGGRGGTSSDYIIGKISKIEGDNETFVDINAGRLCVGGGKPSEIYSDIEKSIIQKTIDQPITKWSELGLTDDEFGLFQKYRFKFTKAADGTFYFSAVEKL